MHLVRMVVTINYVVVFFEGAYFWVTLWKTINFELPSLALLLVYV